MFNYAVSVHAVNQLQIRLQRNAGIFIDKRVAVESVCLTEGKFEALLKGVSESVSIYCEQVDYVCLWLMDGCPS